MFMIIYRVYVSDMDTPEKLYSYTGEIDLIETAMEYKKELEKKGFAKVEIRSSEEWRD